MSNNTFETMGAFGIVLGAIGLVWGIFQTKKSNDVAKKLDISMAELEKRTPISISEDMVKKAATNAIDREVSRVVTATANNVRNDIKDVIRKKVNTEIEKNIDGIHDRVEDKIDELISEIDESAFIADMKAEAKKAMLAKYNGCLDGIAGDFKDRLNDFGTLIHRFVANPIEQKSNNSGRMYIGFGD